MSPQPVIPVVMTDTGCLVCRTDYRDARERIARRLLCDRGFESACP
jgi:hypothetical protein